MTPLQRTSETQFAPPKATGQRQLTPLEAAITDAARQFQEEGTVLIYFMDKETKTFTGFAPIPKPRDDDED